MRVKGKVFLVGAGPGDRGLISVKGLELIRKADVIIHDELVDHELLAEAGSKTLIIDAGKRAAFYKKTQSEINRLLIKHAKKNKVVVRLKGGDPFIFARGAEEAEALVRARIPFEVVPAVTAASAVCYAGIPLSHRDYSSKIVLVTATTKDGVADLSNIPRDSTLVIYMGIRKLQNVVNQLGSHGWDRRTPAAVIEWASMPSQRVVEATLFDIVRKVAKDSIKAPAIMVVGEVVNLRKNLKWFELKPLYGKKVVVTRPLEQARVLADKLSELGASVQVVPVFKIVETNLRLLDAYLAKLSNYNCIIFTSQNAVRIFFDRLLKRYDSRALANLTICAVGRQTSGSLLKYGFKPDIVPDKFTTERLAQMLKKKTSVLTKALHPCGLEHSRSIKRVFEKAGSTLDEVIIYRYQRLDISKINAVKDADIITLTSAQIAKEFLSQIGSKLKRGCAIACIGPVTAAAVKKFGLKPRIIPKNYDTDSMVDSLVPFQET